MSFQGAGIFTSKINIRNGINFEISLCSCSLSFLVTVFSVWVKFTAFEMEQSLRVMFSVQGNAVSAEVSLQASRIIACKKLC